MGVINPSVHTYQILTGRSPLSLSEDTIRYDIDTELFYCLSKFYIICKKILAFLK